MRHGGHSLGRPSDNSTPFMNFRRTSLIEPDQAGAPNQILKKLGRSRHVADFSRSRAILGFITVISVTLFAPTFYLYETISNWASVRISA
jgi:hypothetical protein